MTRNACPFHLASPSASLTRREALASKTGAAIERDGDMFRVHDFALAREVLRLEEVRQAGFMAELVSDVPSLTRQPVLFAEGELHHEMRRSTAKYFTPTQMAQYRPAITMLADELVAKLHRERELDLDALSLRLAVNVAAQVLGLTNSVLPGLEQRVTAFVNGGNSEPGRPQDANLARNLLQQRHILAFYLLDVKPAIVARRREAQDDLISHLIARGYTDLEIVTECLTYGTAGMVTTREFISAAAYHLFSHPDLKSEYLHATQRDRHALLHEILRLEPVVTLLYRRTLADIELGGLSIPKGSVLALNVQEANVDPQVAGERSRELCPGRSLPRNVQAPVLSFGDGHHRCPGAYLAIEESDLFLRRLLIWQDVEMVRAPDVSYNEVVKGYELRGLRIAVKRP